jgi:hypothetical protein
MTLKSTSPLKAFIIENAESMIFILTMFLGQRIVGIWASAIIKFSSEMTALDSWKKSPRSL